MASPNAPGLRPAIPSARYAGQMGAAAGLSRGVLQPEPTSSSLAAAPAPSEPTGQPATAAEVAVSHPRRIPRWLERTELFLRVMLRMYIGLAVCYAPWSHTFWDQNPIFVQFPTLAIYAANGAVRGIVSGLGLLNLWIALHQAFRHRDR